MVVFGSASRSRGRVLEGNLSSERLELWARGASPDDHTCSKSQFLLVCSAVIVFQLFMDRCCVQQVSGRWFRGISVLTLKIQGIDATRVFRVASEGRDLCWVSGRGSSGAAHVVASRVIVSPPCTGRWHMTTKTDPLKMRPMALLLL